MSLQKENLTKGDNQWYTYFTWGQVPQHACNWVLYILILCLTQ